MKLFLNHKLVHAKEAMVSIFDHGFLYGIGLFETFRTYGGKPFLLAEHLERLKRSADQLGIAYTLDYKQIEQQVSELLLVNELQEGYFRLTITAGEGELGLPLTDYDEPNIILMAKALPPPLSHHNWTKGKTACCLQTIRNTPEADIRYKSLHYMNNVIAKRELRLHHTQYAAHAEGILLNAQGYITEGIVSNVFFRKDNVVYTPAVSTGILPGITRAFVIKLCKQANIEVVEGCFNWPTLFDADEVWLTNSIQAITSVTMLVAQDGQTRQVGNGAAGEYTTKIYSLYEAYIAQKEKV